jgi:hypothetical protein
LFEFFDPQNSAAIAKGTNTNKRIVTVNNLLIVSLLMRMSMRRFTRLTNAFSKKVENLGHSIALHFMYYNFCRIHQSLRVTPAMEAEVTDCLWNIEDIINLLS